MSSGDNLNSELSRELSLFQITMMGIGMMIGAGVFIGIGNAIHHAGPGGVVLTFALNGVIAIFTAMSYAELSSAIPRAGGAFNFARIAFGRGTSFIAGWMEWFASSVAGSAYAITFSIYIWRYLEALGLIAPSRAIPPAWALLQFNGLMSPWVADIDLLIKITAVLIVAFFIYINYWGASKTGAIGAIMTLGQTLFLIVIGVIGVIVVTQDPSRLQNFKPFLPHGWGVLLVTMGFTYVAFEGYEVIAQTGDEAIEPRKNLPKAMLYSVLVVTVSYVAVAFATVVAVKAGSPEVGSEVWRWIGSHGAKGFGEAVSRIMPAANFLLTVAVIFASTSALNATIYSATRASYALGRDRMLPPLMARIAHKRKTPWIALLGTGLIIVTVAVFFDTMDVASSASIMFLFLFFLVNLCVVKIRRTMGDELHYGYLMPLFPLFPLLAIVCQAILAINLHEVSVTAWIIGPTWIGIGVIIYKLYSRHHAVPSEHEILVLEDEQDKTGKKNAYRIMVALANPNNALELVQSTYRIVSRKQAQVELLHMVPVPEQVPLTDAERYMLEGKESIVEMLLYLKPLFPVNTTIRYCRNIARGIVSAIREKQTDLLIMGWHGRRRSQAFSLGSTLDPVIERSPAAVVVFKDCGNRKFHKVLVPVAGGPNCQFALEVAGILKEKRNSTITAFHVDTGKKKFDVHGYVQAGERQLGLKPGSITIKTTRARNLLETILAETEHHDLVVIGTTRQSPISQYMKAALPEALALRCSKPLAMVKAGGGLRSWLKRFF